MIAVSLVSNRGMHISCSEETDKAPLTDASSCFFRLCHHMTLPLDVCLSFVLFIPIIAAFLLSKSGILESLSTPRL